MKKIIVGLTALTMSLGLVANAQMMGNGASGAAPAQNGEMERVQTQAQIHEPGTGLLGATSSQPVRTQLREDVKTANQGVQTELKNQIKVEQEKLMQSREEIRNEIRTMVASGTASSSQAVKSLVQKMQEERDAFRSNVDSLRAEAQTKEAQARQELQTKLQAIKNQTKVAAVENVDQNIAKINSGFIDRWTNATSQLDSFLAKIVSGVSAVAASSTGKDLSAVNSAISDANNAISAAKSAIETQAQKTYTITVTTEANLKADVSATRTALNKDLSSVKDLIQVAHSAVTKALIEYNKIK